MDSDAAGNFSTEAVLLSAARRRGRREVAWTDADQLQEIIDSEDKNAAACRTMHCRRAGKAGITVGAPHGDQVSQGDEHSELARSARLVEGEK